MNRRLRLMADEVHSIHTATEDMVLYCTKCGRTKQVKKGEFIFIREKGKCTCSWGCCKDALPCNEKHEIHLAYKPAPKNVYIADTAVIDTLTGEVIAEAGEELDDMQLYQIEVSALSVWR